MNRIKLALPAPYVGLRPFGEKDALLFFGREQHVGHLLTKLERQARFTAIVGPSGSGKSSLVRAGLVPALHRGALASAGVDWNIYIMKPGDAPLSSLANALAADRRWLDGDSFESARAALGAALASGPSGLVALLRQKADQFKDKAHLLVVDQFEEIFRYRQRNADEAEAFVQLLLRSASEPLPFFVAITMRSDFLGHCADFPGLAEAVSDGVYLTPRLGPEPMRSVIASPLGLVGGAIDPVLVTKLINALQGDDELPVLEHALLRMWRRARSMGRTQILQDDFESVCAAHEGDGTRPRISASIDNHADEIYATLGPAAQGSARMLFVALVERREGRDVRRPQRIGELKRLVGTSAEPSLQQAISAFLAEGVELLHLSSSRGNSDAWFMDDDVIVDISHESLFRQWRKLKGWLREEEADANELREWQARAAHRATGGGWLDDNDCARASAWTRRAEARPDPAWWAQRYGGDHTYREVREYLHESVARNQAEKDQREQLERQAQEAQDRAREIELEQSRRLGEEQKLRLAEQERASKRQRLFTILLSVASIVLAAGMFHIYSISKEKASWSLEIGAVLEKKNKLEIEAKAAKDEATHAISYAQSVKQEAVAEADRLRADADKLLKTARAAQASATEQTSIARSRELASHTLNLINTNTEAAIVKSLDALDAWQTEEAVRSLRIALARRIGLSGTRLTEGSNVGNQPVRPGAIPVSDAWVKYSASTSAFLTWGEDSNIRVWDANSGDRRQVLGIDNVRLTEAQFTSRGDAVYALGGDSTVRFWPVSEVSRPSPSATTTTFPDKIKSAVVSQDGKWLAARGSGSEAYVSGTDTTTKSLLHTLQHDSVVSSIALTPDQKHLVSIAGSSVRLWNIDRGQQISRELKHHDMVTAAAVTSDNRFVVTADAAHTVRRWDLANTRSSPAEATPGNQLVDPILSLVLLRPDASIVGINGCASVVAFGSTSDSAKRPRYEVLTGKVGRANEDGRFCATIESDGGWALWSLDAKRNQREQSVTGNPDSRISDVDLSRDGSLVASAHEDGSFRIWDSGSGWQLAEIQKGSGALASIRFTADSNYVVVVQKNGLVLRYRCLFCRPLADMRREARASLKQTAPR